MDSRALAKYYCLSASIPVLFGLQGDFEKGQQIIDSASSALHPQGQVVAAKRLMVI